MKIKYFLLILAIIHFSSIFAQNDPFAKIKTPEDATFYLQFVSENFKAVDEKILPILIEKGADVNVVNKNNVTPLVSMIFANSTQGAKTLLDAGAKTDIIIPNSYDTPFTLAIRHGVKNKNIQIFDLFLNAKADVNFKNGDGFTPLYASALWGSPVMMAKLIKAGANPNISNSKTPSPLHAAIIKKDFVLAELLLKAGADINLQILNGETPLARAIKFDPRYLMKNINKLIELGADVNLSNNDKKSPLHLAAEKNNLPLVQKLLNAGAKVNHQSLDGSTALYIASSLGYTNIVKSLLDAKADVNRTNSRGLTPLFIACVKNAKEIAALLLNSGANPNISDTKKQTSPLHIAAERNNVAIMMYLMKAKANIDAQTSNGATPLFMAASKGHALAVQTLLIAKTNKHLTATIDKTTRSPLVEAQAQKHGDIVTLLNKGLPRCNKRFEQGIWDVFVMADYYSI